LACHYFNLGPTPPTDTEIQKIKKWISDLCDDFYDVVDPFTRKWLYVEILRECVHATFVLHGWWAVKTKYQLDELANRDHNTAELFQECLDSLNCNEEILKPLCRQIFQSLAE